ncbi:MAG: PfkB domain-containing protein, ribokinase [Candidatus Gottesmanbacteria bacterium GW2011_GWA2_43_14]|uniref:PfkB domain-containing protein, ribokinase n=1 Tax=Candidatus Gottesmanbacteria bacterium GW2011_GWA2_43_14 TaxID=1618443 RepID=A0A0G1DK15_9BACT|nr:MAG: PfkB domain-containing protein, ribokinase [Candidatus Gottesmanbacteria bacterium GW2011_GWA2_43_14]
MVYGCGSVVLDALMLSNKGIHLNQKNSVKRQKIQIGGVIPSALMTLSRLGIKTSLIASVGNDLFGDAVVKLLKKEKVDLRYLLKTEDHPTPLAFVTLNEMTGERTSFYTTGVFSELREEEIKLHLDNKTKLLLIDGHNLNLSLNLARQAQGVKAKVLLDLGSPKKGIEALISAADVVMVPRVYIERSGGGLKDEEVVKKFSSLKSKIVVLTMEEKGSLVINGSEIFSQPAFKVKAVDTNGAGDIFFGSFAFGMLNNWDLRSTTRFATGAAALSCTKFGKEFPTIGEIEEFLNSANEV